MQEKPGSNKELIKHTNFIINSLLFKYALQSNWNNNSLLLLEAT